MPFANGIIMITGNPLKSGNPLLIGCLLRRYMEVNMKNYSYDDMRQMQDDAIQRVREMQRKSAAAADIAREEVGEISVQVDKSVGTGKSKIPDTPKHIQMPALEPNYEQIVEEPVRENENRMPQRLDTGLKSLLNDDAMLMALIMLLSGEGGDNTLVYALIYILAG